ncbi:MAG: TolC family protein [Thiotrichales bacterium]|nr:TolC family protein [Thiotrichales bacterium]
MLKYYFSGAGLCACLFLTPIVYGATAAPGLSNWVSEIIYENPQVQAQQAALETARAQARAAGRPLFNPALELDYQRAIDDAASVGISQTFDWSDKRGARTSVAQFEVQAAVAGLALTRQQLANELLSRLSAYHAASALERIAHSRVELMGRFVELSQRRREAGDLGQIELDLARLASAQARFQYASAAAKRITEKQALAAVDGQFPTDLPVLPELPPAIEPDNIDKENLLAALPTMFAARARMDAARSQVQLQLRGKRPNPTLGFRVGKEESSTLTGLTLSIPLFVRNTFSAEVDVANSQLIQSQQEAVNIRRRGAAQIDAAAQRYQLLRSSWLVWQAQGQASLDQQTSVLERLWRVGELNTTDYLVQVKQTLDTQAGAVEQHGQMWQAWSGWLAASGQVEKWLNLAGEQQ